MAKANTKHDPLKMQWIEMAMRQLTNEALGLYTASPSNFKKVKKALKALAKDLREDGKSAKGAAKSGDAAAGAFKAGCPDDYNPCRNNPRACCPDII